ncbi:MAG: NTP transferase domain-containing protein [Candidatus Pacebacteria bacterium]|nr:NTP transferase domain-containing protein [Candidatus Paceibacterota bacterium]MBP9839473.1 NTP transferase domain-containing protein [Candidatus Paceibacterota bacterium]
MDKINLNNVQVIILAAGKGKRMQSENPKALTNLKGKPFLKHILDTLSSVHLTLRPIIVVGHKKEAVMEAIGEGYHYAHQEEQLGTGHAVSSAKHKVEDGTEIIFVLSTDQPMVSKETILNIIKRHEDKKPTVTIGTLVLPDFNEWRKGLMGFGRIIRDEGGKVVRNVEFKDATDDEKNIREVNPAIYAFDANWLWDNIDKIKNNNAQGEYYLTDLIGLACKNGKGVEAVPIDNLLEGLQPNSKEELEILESLTI